MKPKFLSFFLLLITFSSFSQPYGNEWINLSQSYYKFPIAQNGTYRISQNELINAGISLSGLDPRNIQIYSRGEEIPIYIEGESDGSFDTNDFIEFYASKNDGQTDIEFYGSSNSQANPYYSLFTDSLYYYLTWNSSTSNLRFQSETDVNYTSYTAAQYVWMESLVNFNSTYYDGNTESGGGTDPKYVPSEGWLDFPVSLGGNRIKNIPTPFVFNSGPNATINWRICGESNYAKVSPDHHLSVQFASQTFDTLYEGYELISKSFNVPSSALGSSNTSFNFRSINDLGSGADRFAISFIRIKYPRQLNFSNATQFDFSVQDQGGQTKAYLPFTGFNSIGSAWIYDLTNSKRINVSASGSNYQALIPNAGNEKKCHLFSDGNVFSISNLKALNGNGIFTDYTSLDVNDAFLILSHNSLLSSVNQYASYRNTTGKSSVVIDVEELYHQFGYGVRTHPYSIRRFLDLIHDTWTNQPSDLFLIGKSIKAKDCRKDPINFSNNILPSFGNPCSDNLLSAGLNGTVLEPLLPTGRLSAKNSTEVIWYLDKVVEFESNGLKNWMKNILHFAGGRTSSESDRFANYLASFEDILEDTAFGGNVKTFKKSTSAPIQISLSDSIRNLINGGTSLLTFFGHASSTGGFDQNIDDPENYNNKGKYPLLVGNSCFTGDIHESHGESVSEEFVIIKDKGVIAFLASVDLGLEGRLNDYSRNFFKSLGQKKYGASIGEHMIYAIQQVQQGGTTYPNRSVALLMTLHGDPSLVLNAHELPDYEITAKQVRTIPETVTTASDTFELEIEVFNYGRAINDSLRIEVIRVYPDLSSEIFSISSAPVKYGRMNTIKIPVNASKGSGFNRLDISLDPSNLISEINEGNNFLSFNLYIKSGDLIPTLPYNYAIIPGQSPILKASTGYAFDKLQEYEMQLDTTDLFISPIETSTFNSEGGVISWKPKSLENMKDSMVYFWRSRNTSGDENSIWRTSSFQYIPNKRGWSQDHFFQFRNDSKLFVGMNDTKRQFEFSPSIRKLTCQTSSTLNFSDLGDILYKLDADLQEYGGCGLGPAIHIAVLDSLSFEPWGTPYLGQNANHYFGQVNKDGNCGKPRVQKFFIFRANVASELAGLKDMLVNKVPNGNYVLAWTWIKNDFSQWDAIDPSMRNVFTTLGSDTIDDISNDSLPFIFFVKKGRPETKVEVLGANWDEFITLNADLVNNNTYGSITSTLIGPSSSWDSLHWNSFALESPTSDSIALTMKGLSKDLSSVMAQKTFQKNENLEDISALLSNESAPFMELDLNLADNLNQTSPQLDRWMVLYEGVMDLALNASDHFEFNSDTLAEGENLRFSLSVKNISEYDADSVLIDYYIIDRNRNRIDIEYPRQKGLPADSSFITEIELNTLGLKGVNTLVIEVNPRQDQLEQHSFNNVGQIPFFVKGDNINPILDVTFDGVHILDGDIVSAKPEITIQLSDENAFLLLDDTSDIKVFVSDPMGREQQYYFQSSSLDYNMEFIAASGTKNKAQVILNSTFVEDGIYALRVQAKDRSNNESGDVDYRITFEVINRSTITNLMNYPNPFSTSTQFVFVLTGSKVPDNMQIQIMTISGKIVKNIYMYELGPIRIGRNVTDYTWDGRDEYGDKLANGVYLYRVNTRLNGQEIEHRSTSADSYFKQGFGKMVILR